MNGHQHAVPQLLLDLRRVAVAADLVRRDRLVDRHEVLVVRRLAAGAADARLGVDHHVAEQARPRERGQREDRRGRVAAGVGHQVGARDLVAVQLRQPVDRVAHQRRAPDGRRTSPRTRRPRAAGSRPTGRRRARLARAARRPPGPRRRAGRRPRRRRPASGGRGRTPRAPAARASAGAPRRAARRRPSARSRGRARSAGGGAAARWPRRPRSRPRPAPRRLTHAARPRGARPRRRRSSRAAARPPRRSASGRRRGTRAARRARRDPRPGRRRRSRRARSSGPPASRTAASTSAAATSRPNHQARSWSTAGNDVRSS